MFYNINLMLLDNLAWVLDATRSPMSTFLINLLRTFQAWFDGMVIVIINWSFSLLMSLADVNLFGEEVLKMFGHRVYLLISIFMLFKLAIVFIRYLADPDQLTDTTVGMGNIIKKTLIALLLLVLVPFIFEYAYKFQSFVLQYGVMERIFFGQREEIGDEQSAMLSFAVYSGFFYPDPEVVGDECNAIYFTPYDSPDWQSCIEAIKAASTDDSDVVDVDTDYVVRTFESAVAYQDAEILMQPILVSATTPNNMFLFKYLAWGSILGVLVGLLLVQFCFDIAIRAVKLGFLQLIAPIPIILSLDPNSKLFEKWYTMSIATFVDLFIRLAAIFFAVFVIALVWTDMGITSHATGETIAWESGNRLLIMFIIVGALLFAKQLPNLVSDLLDVKFDGAFTLNPFTRLKQVPVVGKTTAVGSGIIGGGLGGAIAGADSGTSVRAAAHGAITGGLAGNRSTGVAGEAEGQKEHFSMYQGAQAAYKDYTGNEMAVLSSERIVKHIPWIGKIDKKVIDKRLEEVKKPLKELASKEQELKLDLSVETSKLQEMSKEMGEQLQRRDRELQNLERLRLSGEMDDADYNDRKSKIISKYSNMEANFKQSMEDQREAIFKRQKVLKGISDDIEIWKDQLKDIRTAGKVDVSRKEKMKEVKENMETKWNKSTDEILRNL